MLERSLSNQAVSLVVVVHQGNVAPSSSAVKCETKNVVGRFVIHRNCSRFTVCGTHCSVASRMT